MSISAEYEKSLTSAARGALLRVIADHPSTPVADLRELVSQHPSLGGLTLADLFGKSRSNSGAGRSTKPAQSGRRAAAAGSKPAAAPKRTDKWDTRTDAGRAALDRAVYETLGAFGGTNVSAEAIRARLGATPAQIRTSLNRHIVAGDVSFSGKARGTRYTVEG
jgi:hypothetical protein